MLNGLQRVFFECSLCIHYCVCIVHPFKFQLYWAAWRHMEQFSSPTPFLHVCPMLAPLPAEETAHFMAVPHPRAILWIILRYFLLLWSTDTRSHTQFLDLSSPLVWFHLELFTAALLARLQAVGHYLSLAHSGLITNRKTSFHYKKKFTEVNLLDCSHKEVLMDFFHLSVQQSSRSSRNTEKSSKTINK